MDPLDFYHQAANWYADAADQKSVTARSIVSRAYYAAFLIARKRAGVTSFGDVHQKTINWFLQQKGPDVVIANKLDGLRQMRTRADYDMDRNCVRRDAGEALRRSLDLLQRFGVI